MNREAPSTLAAYMVVKPAHRDRCRRLSRSTSKKLILYYTAEWSLPRTTMAAPLPPGCDLRRRPDYP